MAATPDFSSQETGFAAGVLQALGVSASSSAYGTDINLLSAQQVQEGQWGATGQYNATVNNNPFNLESIPSSSKVKSAGVQPSASLIFSTAQQGEQATADFIRINDPAIAAALKANSSTTAEQGFFSNIGGWISHYNQSNPDPAGASATAADIINEQNYSIAVQKVYTGDKNPTLIYPTAPTPTSKAGNALTASNAQQTQGSFLDSLALVMTPQIRDSKGIVGDIFGQTVGDITDPANIWSIIVAGMLRGAIALLGLGMVGVGLFMLVPALSEEVPGIEKLTGAIGLGAAA